MHATTAIGVVFAVGCSVVGALPKECYIYSECEDLIGDCCPTPQGVMLECCILGAITLENNHLMQLAKGAEANASKVAEEANDIEKRAEEAEKAVEAAKEKERKLIEAEKEAEKEAAAAMAEYKNFAHRLKAAKCENNQGCADAGIEGFCCPTLVGQKLIGTMLGCCGAGGAQEDAALTAAFA